MLKFFRQIRRKLFIEGNLKRYLVYAIGEILLVMIGILLALQVSNWNEQRKAKKEELTALNDLVVEFRLNKQNFQLHAQRQRDVESLWQEYLSQVSNFQLPDSIRAKDRPRLGYFSFKISNNKLNSLLTTGYIDRIQSDTLKQLLLTWKDVLLSYQATEEEHVALAKQDLIPTELKLKPNNRLRTITGIETSFYSTQEEQTMALNALKNLEYQNALILNHHWLKLKISRLESINNHLDLIIEQLENSLNDNRVKKDPN